MNTENNIPTTKNKLRAVMNRPLGKVATGLAVATMSVGGAVAGSTHNFAPTPEEPAAPSATPVERVDASWPTRRELPASVVAELRKGSEEQHSDDEFHLRPGEKPLPTAVEAELRRPVDPAVEAQIRANAEQAVSEGMVVTSTKG